MRAALLVLALAASTPATAQTAPFTLGNPDARLWSRADDAWQGTTQLTCRHVVCPRGTTVTARQVSGPARRPDAQSLRRIAAEELPRALASQARGTPRFATTTVQGWPAVRGVIETGREDSPRLAVLHVYMDGATIQFTAVSSDPAYAPRALDAVVAASRFQRP